MVTQAAWAMEISPHATASGFVFLCELSRCSLRAQLLRFSA